MSDSVGAENAYEHAKKKVLKEVSDFKDKEVLDMLPKSAPLSDSKGAGDELDKILFEWVPAGTRHRLKTAILALLAQEVKPDKVDRFEVIDETGRAYVKGSIYGSPVSVELSYQDDGRTLKVFVKSAHPKDGAKDDR